MTWDSMVIANLQCIRKFFCRCWSNHRLPGPYHTANVVITAGTHLDARRMTRIVAVCCAAAGSQWSPSCHVGAHLSAQPPRTPRGLAPPMRSVSGGSRRTLPVPAPRLTLPPPRRRRRLHRRRPPPPPCATARRFGAQGGRPRPTFGRSARPVGSNVTSLAPCPTLDAKLQGG